MTRFHGDINLLVGTKFSDFTIYVFLSFKIV